MISLTRQDRSAILFSLDLDGLDTMLAAFSDLAEGRTGGMKASIDANVLGAKRTARNTDSQVLELSHGRECVLVLTDGRVVWEVTGDDIESVLVSLARAKEQGFFSPAELVQVKTPRSRDLNWIFCELVQPNNAPNSQRPAILEITHRCFESSDELVERIGCDELPETMVCISVVDDGAGGHVIDFRELF